ncbi:uncharacterized protein LOC119293403 [Triticum dicoccoides]|uniref:uncharacterized protein LOC119293403 n=1 Tax=Triticum dicoccoides TaxID=85692 RepID=UPI00189043C7|nr:uncharacterized protein LOC119293403 [Triticum dicoccoides]
MPHVVRLLVLVLFVVSLDPWASKSTASSYHEYPRRLAHHIRMPSLNSSSKVTRTGSNRAEASIKGVEEIPHYCAYQSGEAAYAGTIATMDVYAFPNLKKGQSISAHISVADSQTSNQLVSGWEIDPDLYGDSKTHFFVYWTTDRKNGCSNLDCDGFVPVNLATITPGDTLEPSRGHMNITLKIFKSKEDGDWWLHFGHDINNLSPVGYWPKSLLNGMQDHADDIEWVGSTFSFSGEISPLMGNGHWPRSNSAASFRNVQYIDRNGKGYDPPMGSLHAFESHKQCYRTGVFQLQVQGNMFYYGGPGGCTG